MYFFCNRPEMNASWIPEEVQAYFHHKTRIAICNFYQDDEWASTLQSHQQRHVLRFVESLQDYGISRESLQIIHPRTKTVQEVHNILNNVDVIFICGDTPESIMMSMREYQITTTIKEFQGLVLMDAIASLVALETYESTYEPGVQYPGLHIVSSFLLDSMYVEDVNHLGRLVRLLEDQDKPIVGFDHTGGVLIDHNHYELLGNAFVVSDDDIDAIYQAYYDAKERYEYYGDNGNY